MKTRHSELRRTPRITSTAWLAAAACIILILCLFSPLHVSAEPARRPDPDPAISTRPVGPWIVQQEALVQAQVIVRGQRDVAALRRLGYSCSLGRCDLVLREADALALMALGMPVRMGERAIRVSGRAAPAIAFDEGTTGGSNADDLPIPDANPAGCGDVVISPIAIAGPPGWTATRVKFGCAIYHAWVGDLNVWLQNDQGQGYAYIWDRYGASSDQGGDDDQEDDEDIEFVDHWFMTEFDGDAVQQTWQLYAQDCSVGDTGYIDEWSIDIWFELPPCPGLPADPSPSDGATDVPLDADLDWADASDAADYDVLFGSPDPVFVATTTSSSYALETLQCDTEYHWQIVAQNPACNAMGPEWTFTTVCCLPGAPSNPSPPIGATGQPIDVDLTWNGVPGATSYDVYFGPSAPPPFLATTASAFYDLPTLQYSTTYYWLVAARNDCGATPGGHWDFATQGEPATPTPPPSATPTHTPSPTPTGTTVPTPTPTLTPTHTLTPECPADACEPNEGFFQACPIVAGQEYTAYICPDTDLDWFRFGVTAGQQMTVTLYGASGQLPADYDLYLLHPSGGEATHSISSGTTNEQAIFTATETGDYRATVRGFYGTWSATGPYQLRVTLSGTVAETPTTTPSPTGTPPATPTLTPTLTPVATSTPTLTPPATSTLTPPATLTPTPTGTPPATPTPTPSSTQGAVATATVTAVCPADGYEPNESLAQAYPIAAGTEYRAYICPEGDQDHYKFWAVTGQWIIVRLDELPAAYDLELFDPHQSLRKSTYGSTPDPRQVSMVADVTGYWYARVLGRQAGRWSRQSYRLMVTTGRIFLPLLCRS